jgi:hypothetical protein
MDRSRDKCQPVIVTAEDILYADHGQAPSRSAVNQLIHWANRPAKFYEQLLAEHKKRPDDTHSHAESVDPGLGEVRAYLDQMKEVADGQ